MLDDCTYDKIKVLYDLSEVLWFLKKHALQDANNDAESKAYFEKLAQDLEQHVSELKAMTCK